MKIAFYRAKYGTWFDKLIALITRSGFSHCELVFSDGTCFSASNRDGVRFATIDFTSGHWELVDVEVTPAQESVIIAWCVRQEGSKYDWIGVFFGWAGVHQSSKWFCPEICSEALMIGTRQNTFQSSKSISPEKLYRWMV